ncbi:hypothetical protein [Alkaliflexus imshenetskii]|uniref:hypothetical protein n=1 Tax=Alkaliflexus imshenetskii TaxID=286730 RepID=UPI0004B3CD3A|nr:hypothetical protein [Alkaliflexus imshenetskii]
MKTNESIQESEFQLNARELLENYQMIEIRGGTHFDSRVLEDGNCHGNGCNQTCKKNQ